jgi:hypothetical protein
VKKEALSAVSALGSMGVGLSPCIVPRAGKPGFVLGEDEIELGLGIHGEAGVRRGTIESADTLAATLLDRIIDQTALRVDDRVALLVNNLGGTPAMEIMIIARAALRHLEARGLRVERVWAGTFLTAIEMAGCSLSLLKLDDHRLARLDAPAVAPAWVAGQVPQRYEVHERAKASVQTPGSPSPLFETALRAICASLLEAEPKLTAMDQIVGDGDLSHPGCATRTRSGPSTGGTSCHVKLIAARAGRHIRSALCRAAAPSLAKPRRDAQSCRLSLGRGFSGRGPCLGSARRRPSRGSHNARCSSARGRQF